METRHQPRTQVNIKSERLRELLDTQSQKLNLPIKECAEILVQKGIDYDVAIAKAKREVVETKMTLEALKTKASLAGIDLENSLQENIAAHTNQELGMVELRRKAEELEALKNEKVELLATIEKINKKASKYKKKVKRLQAPDFIDRIFSKIEDNPNVAGMLLEKFTGKDQQQLAGTNSNEEADKLFQFFVKNFQSNEDQGMMVHIMQLLAADKNLLQAVFNQLTQSNETAN